VVAASPPLGNTAHAVAATALSTGGGISLSSPASAGGGDPPPGGGIRRMVCDYFAEIIDSKDSVLLVISFDYSDYFQIIFRLFSDYHFLIIIYDLLLLFMVSDYFLIIFELLLHILITSNQ
jgi:hypothetical protein